MFNFSLTLQGPFARLVSDGVVYEILCRVRDKDNASCIPNFYFSVDIIDAQTNRFIRSSESRQYATGKVLVYGVAQNDN